MGSLILLLIILYQSVTSDWNHSDQPPIRFFWNRRFETGDGVSSINTKTLRKWVINWISYTFAVYICPPATESHRYWFQVLISSLDLGTTMDCYVVYHIRPSAPDPNRSRKQGMGDKYWTLRNCPYPSSMALALTEIWNRFHESTEKIW